MSAEDEAQPVDRYVVVEPARRDQIPRLGRTVLAPGDDVVDLEPVPAVIDDASVPVTVDDRPTQRRWDRPARIALSHRFALLAVDDHVAHRVAEDGIEGVPSHGGTRLM